MKKFIFLLLFLILIFSLNVTAAQYGGSDDEYTSDQNAYSNNATTNIRYRTAGFTITLSVNGETKYTLTGLSKADLHFDGSSTRIWMTSADLCSRLAIDENQWAQLKAANVYIYCAATIQIYNKNNPSNTLATIYSKDTVDSIAGPFNFMAIDYIHMKQRYGALNLFDTVPVIPVIPPNAGGGGTDPSDNNIGLVAWLDYPNNLENNNQKIEADESRTSLKIKSGYGIKVFAQLQDFNFEDKEYCPIGQGVSRVGAFYIDGITTTVEQSGFGEFVNYWYSHAVSGLQQLYDWDWQGSGENYEGGNFTLDYSLIKNTFYPKGYRKIYTDPLTPDGYYIIYVKAVVATHWTEENIHQDCHWVYDIDGNASPCCHIQHPKDYTETYVSLSNNLNIQIQESMFDDDQNVFVKPE